MNLIKILLSIKKLNILQAIIIFVFFPFIIQSTDKYQNEVVTHYYTAPNLEEVNVIKKGICVRPGHKEPYDLSFKFKEIEEKLIITTSGFGGSGITLGEGAVEHQINRLEKESHKFFKHNKETEIAIIGSGLIGSLTALHLHERGYKNLLMITDKMTSCATPNAGGYIAASIDRKHQEFKKYNEFCIESFKRFSQSLNGCHPFIIGGEDAIKRLPVYRSGGKSPALENYVERGLMSSGFDVKLEIIDNNIYHNLYCYEDAMYVNPSILLSLLHRQISRYQIPIHQKHVTNLKEITSKIVFNCTGALAGRLTGKDEDYEPTLGHYLLLCNQDESSKGIGFHNSMLVVQGNQFETSNGLVGRTSLNFFPKMSSEENYQAYLGGTFIKNVKLNQNGYVTEDYEFPEQFEAVLKNARDFFGYSH